MEDVRLRYPCRVITPMKTTWGVRFLTEDAAWARILSVHKRRDNPANRAQLIREGWKVEVTSPVNWSDRL